MSLIPFPISIHVVCVYLCFYVSLHLSSFPAYIRAVCVSEYLSAPSLAVSVLCVHLSISVSLSLHLVTVSCLSAAQCLFAGPENA